MPPKSKSKGGPVWYKCDVCRVVLAQKDIALHQEGSCPPSPDVWAHGYIHKKTLYSWPEVVDSSAKAFPSEEVLHMVWVSSQALQLCGLCVGDPVIVTVGNVATVKTVWPTTEKSLTSVLMTQEAIELAFSTCEAPVSVCKLPCVFPPAQEIELMLKNRSITEISESADVLLMLRHLYMGKYVRTGDFVCVPFYGKKLKFLVESIKPMPGAETTEKGRLPSDDINMVTETFQNMSFGEGQKIPETFSSTPLKPTHNRVAALQKETISDDSSADRSLDESNYLDESNVRNFSRKMMDDSYAYSLTGESEGDTSQTSMETSYSPFKPIGRNMRFFHVVSATQWKLCNSSNKKDESEPQRQNLLATIGGLQKLIEELQEIITLALKPSVSQSKGLKVARGVLLYGPPGTGKSLLARALAQESKAVVHTLQGSELFSKYLGETESRLKAFFDKASLSGPSFILLDDVDSLCPKRTNNSGGTELERRVVSTLSSLLDGLGGNIFVLATTSKPDSVDPTLRRPGRLDREVEVPVPSPIARLDILLKLLVGVPHSLNEEQLQSIAHVTHGFVGADLASLVSKAGARAVQLEGEEIDVKITLDHMEWALTRVNPSAMREVLVDVPNVHWTDIAGQEDLKLKLRQAVEWPLAHPEAFERLGIRPPRGVLMFGPPGCSKTMIAKALATESKLNFLSIKGPELFSKWVGESEKAVRQVFHRARQVSPAIVFFDELDALGGERSSSGGGGGSNVQERVLAQLLTEMDGITTLGSVTVVAATNRPDRIDKALLRPGRLDRIVYVPLPDDATRRQIFQLQLCKMPVEESLDIECLVQRTKGYSGAEVLAVCHEAALKALEEDLSSQIVRESHFYLALTIVTPRTPPSLLKLYDDYLIPKYTLHPCIYFVPSMRNTIPCT